MNRKKQIKSITEAGIFVALYCLLAIITRYLITGTDSMLYYIWPLPIAIYSARTKLSYSIAATLASIVLSFLFANPMYVLMLIIPNIFIGFLLGTFEKIKTVKIINYLIVFIICLIADFLSVYAYELITGVSYWQDMINPLSKLLNFFIDINQEKIINLVKIISVVVLIIDSVIKTVFLYVLFILIVKRLKLIDNYQVKLKIPLRYHYLMTIIYIALLMLTSFLAKIFLTNNTWLLEIIYILSISVLFILSIYILYQVAFFIRLKIKTNSNIYMIILLLLEFILFPISIIIGLILNLINWNYFKELI